MNRYKMNRYRQRKRNLYNPSSKTPFRISRGKIDLFLECPRCFYLDRRLGLGRPSMPGWALNSAVDQLLKNGFDLLRERGEQHKLMEKCLDSEKIPDSDQDCEYCRYRELIKLAEK